MLSILKSIAQRLQELETIDLLDVFKIQKFEKERIKTENQQLDLLYKFQRVSQDEKSNFYLQSLRIMNKEHTQLISPTNIYDLVATLYIEYFQEKDYLEKANKIQLIVKNDMHKNQSFLLLMCKWLLEFLRNKLKNVLTENSRPQTRLKYPLHTIESIKRKQPTDQLKSRKLKGLSLSKTPEIDIQTPIRSRKPQSSIHTRHNILYDAIPDVDWEYQKENGFKQLLSRNIRIHKTILKHL